MVDLVENWDDLEEYAEWCRYGTYQIGEGIDGKEVRVMVGRFGFIRIFSDLEDALYKRIIKFCKGKGFIKILNTVPEEIFFKTSTPET